MRATFEKKDIYLLKRALKYISPHRVKFILAFFCIFSGVGVGLVGPLLWGRILNSLFQKNLSVMMKNVIYSLIVGLSGNAISYLQAYLFASLNQNIIFDIKQDMYSAMLNLPIKAYDDISSGEFMSRLHGDTTQVANAITEKLLAFIVNIIRLMTIGIMIFAINIKLACIVIIALPLSIFIFNRYGKKIRVTIEQLAKVNDRYYCNTAEVIRGIREVKSLGIKGKMFETFLNVANKLKRILIKIALLSSMSETLANTVNVIIQTVVVLVGGVFTIRGSLSIQYFVAFYSYIGQFSESLFKTSRINLDIQEIMNSLERIFFLIDGLAYQAERFGEKEMACNEGEISIRDIYFQYQEGKDVLHGITMNIPAKSRTAIVGSSGSGKTTIFNLLLKLYQPCKGCILIDDVNIEEINEKDLRKHISIVQQEPFIFFKSVKENLLLANQEASQEELECVCKKACIHEFIESLPNKYDTVLGENGINLSGGERQRIAIARALLKKSKIVLFDEATSSLDNESQFYIKKAIDSISKECTVITIAHRLSTIIESDLIYVLDKGEIVGRGSHQSLMQTNPTYKKLYRMEVELINENCKEVI